VHIQYRISTYPSSCEEVKNIIVTKLYTLPLPLWSRGLVTSTSWGRALVSSALPIGRAGSYPHPLWYRGFITSPRSSLPGCPLTPCRWVIYLHSKVKERMLDFRRIGSLTRLGGARAGYSTGLLLTGLIANLSKLFTGSFVAVTAHLLFPPALGGIIIHTS